MSVLKSTTGSLRSSAAKQQLADQLITAMQLSNSYLTNTLYQQVCSVLSQCYRQVQLPVYISKQSQAAISTAGSDLPRWVPLCSKGLLAHHSSLPH